MNSKIFFLCFKSIIKDYFIGTTKALQPYFIDYALSHMEKKSECKTLKISTPFGRVLPNLGFPETEEGKNLFHILVQRGCAIKRITKLSDKAMRLTRRIC